MKYTLTSLVLLLSLSAFGQFLAFDWRPSPLSWWINKAETNPLHRLRNWFPHHSAEVIFEKRNETYDCDTCLIKFVKKSPIIYKLQTGIDYKDSISIEGDTMLLIKDLTKGWMKESKKYYLCRNIIRMVNYDYISGIVTDTAWRNELCKKLQQLDSLENN